MASVAKPSIKRLKFALRSMDFELQDRFGIALALVKGRGIANENVLSIYLNACGDVRVMLGHHNLQAKRAS